MIKLEDPKAKYALFTHFHILNDVSVTFSVSMKSSFFVILQGVDSLTFWADTWSV